MWGTPPPLFLPEDCKRFIPTHVGNTSTRGRGGRGSTVHPHACGEHVDHQEDPREVAGSSPRMWGTPGRRPRRPILGRFIPTHVGNTSSQRTRPGRRSVHPHACGEHIRSEKGSAVRVGSSPRMWGTRRAGRAPRPGDRFIPTHVGNTIL